MTEVKFKKASSGSWSIMARNPRFIYLNLIFIYYSRLLSNDVTLATWPSTVNKSCSVMCKRLSAENTDKDWICNRHQSQKTLAYLGSAWLLQMDWVKLKTENDALKRVCCLYGVNHLSCYASLWLRFFKVSEQFYFKYPLQSFTTSLYSSLTKPLKYTLHSHMWTRSLKIVFFLLQRWWTAK